MSQVSDEVGRLPVDEVDAGVVWDAPEATVRALLVKVDALVDAMKQLKADGYVAAAGVDAAIDGLEKLKLRS